MESNTRISSLIETYRLLNNLDVDALPPMPLRQLRDHELRFSQALKERITGVAVANQAGVGDTPTLGMETTADTPAMLRAQFGTARESTLAMLRDLPAEHWTTAEVAGSTIEAAVDDLIAHDQALLQRLTTVSATAGRTYG